MKILDEDTQLLKELCSKYNLSFEKVGKLIEITKKTEIEQNRHGYFNDLREIIENKNL